MSNQEAKPTTKTESQPSPEPDHDHDEIFEDGEMLGISDMAEKENLRRDARRKIEIYLEKKRLQEEFDDFDESEFGF